MGTTHEPRTLPALVAITRQIDCTMNDDISGQQYLKKFLPFPLGGLYGVESDDPGTGLQDITAVGKTPSWSFRDLKVPGSTDVPIRRRLSPEIQWPEGVTL